LRQAVPSKVRLKVAGKLLALSGDVLPPGRLQMLDVFVGCLGEAQRHLASGGQVEPVFAGVRPELLDRSLCLLPRHSIALAADDPVNALGVHHDIDRVAGVPVLLSLSGDAMLRKLGAGGQCADGGTGEALEAEGH